MRVLYDWVAGVAQPRPQHAARRQLITMPAAAGNHPGHQSATTQARHLTGQGQLPCAHKSTQFCLAPAGGAPRQQGQSTGRAWCGEVGARPHLIHGALPNSGRQQRSLPGPARWQSPECHPR